MKEIIAYEMALKEMPKLKEHISCFPFEEKYWDEYKAIYNACLYEMRKDLEIEPVNFYSDGSQMKDKSSDTFLYLQDDNIIGAVSCYGNEIDDLIVHKPFQGKGFGKKLLLWGVNHIREQGHDEVVLHVAEWNQNAVKLYLKVGFQITKKEKVR
ncbi:MAG: GNAT family N-acetyltransferase [Eubacterium sp.]|nr:GNAT family N-acetyltransferase [Eubacterium sp.]